MQNPNRFYVYILLDPRYVLQPFYIGKGSGRRSKRSLQLNCCGNNKLKSGTIKKIHDLGLEPTSYIYADNLSEEEAFNIEIVLIKRFKRKIDGGILTNLSEGGPAPHRERQSRKRTRNKTILQICSKTGLILQEWASTREAARNTQISLSSIMKSVNMKPWFTGGGFFWRYPESSDIVDGRLDLTQTLNTAKAVYQIDRFGVVVKQWPSMVDAGRSLGINFRNISKVCRDGHQWTCEGYYWRHYGSPEIANGRIAHFNTYPQVSHFIQISPEGNEVGRWRSASEAAKATGYNLNGIWRSSKLQKPFKGFFWNYISATSV